MSKCLNAGVSGIALLCAASAHAQQAPDVTQLPTIVVQGQSGRPNDTLPIEQTTAGPVQGYRALTSRGVTRTETPIEQIPQTIIVLPRKVLDDQGVITQSEVFRNVSGVQPLSTLSAGQGGPSVRGFPAERFVDGLPNFYDYGARDIPINVERIEVLKGPGSIFYQGGPSPIGGAVNIVSKLPTFARFATTGVTVGSYGYVSPFFDVNQPLTDNKTVLFRITGQYERTGGEVLSLDRRTFSINPTLLVDNQNGTILTLQGSVSQHRQRDYPGLPTIGAIDRSAYTVQRDLFAASRTTPKADSRLMSLTARIDHVVNDAWTLNSTARISQARFREPSQFIFSNMPTIAPSTFGIYNSDLDQDQHEVSVNANIVGKFDWGVTKNRVLFGVDYDWVKDNGIFNGAFAGLTNFADPTFPIFTHPPEGAFTTFQKPRNTYEQFGATAQLQSTVWDRLHLLAAVKLAKVTIISKDSSIGFPQNFKTDETRPLPRLGVAYDLISGVTAFAGYSQGLRAVQFYTSAITTDAPKPEESEQVEGGFKLNLAQGLSGTVSAFQITRTNVPVSVGFVQVQSGEQRSQGVEGDVVWQPDPNWSILGNYAYTDARITKDNDLTRVGRDLTGIPRQSGRLWANYTVLDGVARGLSLGGGLYASSSRRIDISGPWRAPGYVTLDAKIAYVYENWTISLVGKNLADRKYFEYYRFLSGRVAPADGRALYATLSSTF